MEKEFVEPAANAALKKEVAQHTPGPWTFGYDDHSGPEYIVGNNKAVATLRWGCSCCKDTPDTFLDMKPEERANARLIAAAPDMLAALQAIINSDIAMREEDEGYVSTELEAARAAILKATSGSRTEGPAPTPLSE